ncbi:MAG: putative Ig domain-containing protein [Nocardioides sp.]
MTIALSVLLALTGALLLSAGPSSAGPVDVGWQAAGPGASTVSQGSDAAASMTYDADGSGSASWTFTTTATPESAAGPISVPYTWEGLHAWFQVRTSLELIVDGVVVDTLVQEGPVDCCTSPSHGFLYGGLASFDVEPGQTYGFRLSGSNRDYNNFLRGTLTLNTRPYVDPSIGEDNRQWLGAADLPATGASGTLDEAGEARWYRFPVVPGQRVRVDLSDLPADYDVALYGDIEAAFERLVDGSDLTQLAAGAAAGAPGAQTQVPEYPPSVTQVPTSAAELPSTQFAPRVYAPRVYAPRVYAPRVYAPRVYAPRVYASDSYVAGLTADPAFRDAFSAAQNQTLLAVSVNTGAADETVSAATGNTDGYFYVRVQGRTDSEFAADRPYRLARTTTGGSACAGLEDYATTPTLAATRNDSRTVIVTDTNKLGLDEGSAEQGTYLDSLEALAAATDGAVVDVHASARIRQLQAQVAAHTDCPYAVNLVARAVKEIVDSYRNGASSYVVIAGGDDVIPFFRYPDVSGLGQESQFEPPVLPDSPSGASLTQDQVQSQDAYGASTEVTIGGASLPVPDLAVGRLVKTPEEIESTIENFLDPEPAPEPSSSLVTGYDFLADAADAVQREFAAALPGGRHDSLITDQGTPLAEAWDATDLEDALLDTHHDLVYLAGHFSANDTLAADFETALSADVLDPAYDGGVNAAKLKDTIVLSAGCHSGYNIVDGAAVPGVTNTFDWTQRMAQQHAVLVGGTGYQYGDTDFLEYSERLYLDLARRLHEGPADRPRPPPVVVGNALVLAKQDYLAGIGTLTGMDQKVVLQATLYGLPMTEFDAPGRTPIGSDSSGIAPQPVTSGPGSTLGLSTEDLAVTTSTTRGAKPSGAGAELPDTLRWLNGDDGVTVQPGAPALPTQVEDVSVPDQLLRGVGFRGGDYTDVSGLLPVTGAPAIEGSTANTTFESEAFFPQRLVNPNYFGALGASGRTSLVVTPAQYRSDRGGALTNTERAYHGLDLRLFYSGEQSTSYGSNQPALAAAPSASDVSGVVRNRSVTFSARVTGDPSAGVQQVWITWTGGPDDSGDGQWRSVDLSQDPTDSTRWSGTLQLPAGQASGDVRFLVQAANGIGAVGLDTAEGDGYRVTTDPGDVPPLEVEPTTLQPGMVGVDFQAGLLATGGTGARSWTLAPGESLPGGLTLAPDGTITGVPTTAGTSVVVVQVADAAGRTASGSLTLEVEPAPTRMVATRAIVHQPPLVLTATLTQAGTERVVAAQTVRFTVGRTVLCTATTSDRGVATCDLRKRPVPALLVILNRGYDATFAATSDYLASSDKAPL